MGKHSQKKKKAKKPKDYERFQYGPLLIERSGRYVVMSSHWKPGAFEKHLEYVRSQRPELKKEIDAQIQELLKIIEENDPFELLASISYKNCFTDPEQYRESAHQGKECHVEFALSIITAHNRHGLGKHATEEAVKRFDELISSIFNNALWFFATEASEKKRDLVEEEFRYRSIMRYVFMRGDSFPEHHLDLIKDLFKPHDGFLKRHYEFSTDEVIAGIQEIENQVVTKCNNLLQGMHNLKEVYESSKKFVDEKGIENFLTMEECFDEFRSLPEIQMRQKELEGIKEALDEISFEIEPSGAATQELLGLLSMSFGDNKDFLQFEKAPGWPTNDSIIYEKSLIKHKGKYYSFMPQLLFRNLGGILEQRIRQKDDEYLRTTYQSKRADILERKALEYFKKLLPGSAVYGKVYYEIEENGQRNRFESDGIILYDNNLFILEAKAGALSTSARRGSLERMKKDVSALIDSAYSQALRTKKYIEMAEKPRFEYEDRSEALIIQDKKKVENIFLVNVTLESLGDLAIRLNSLKHLKLIQGKEWPWSVFINDLRVIAEIVESPSQFLTFLKRRIQANEFPQFDLADELDFLMFYLREGLYLDKINKKEDSTFTLHAYTEELDRYYDYLAGRVSSGDKPTLRTAAEFKEMIRNIEALGKPGFTSVTTTLLDFSGETHKDILNALNRIKEFSLQDGKAHDATFYFKGSKLGVTFFVGPNSGPKETEKMEHHCRLKMYQTRYENWIAVAIDSAGEITSPYDFLMFRNQWKFDEELEQEFKEFKKRKWEMAGMVGQKVGRNQPCPCGSGLKYKKCCGGPSYHLPQDIAGGGRAQP